MERPLFSVAMVKDISGEKRIEEERRQLVSAVTQTQDVVFVTDREGTITYVNPSFTRLYGFTEGEALGKTPRILKSGQMRPEVYEELWTTILAGKPYLKPHTNRTKKGRLIEVDSSINPMFGSAGEVSGFVCVQRDVTERNRLQEALRRSEERLRLAVWGSSDGLWDWPDVNREKQWWSPRVYELIGYPPEELEATHSNFLQLLHPEDRQRVETEGRAHFQQDRPYDIEFRLRRRSGEYRWFRGRGRALRDAAGRPLRMAGSLTDIQERKELEQADRRQLARQIAVAELGRLALAEPRLPRLLEAAARAIVETLEVEYCEILELLPAEAGLRLVAGAGWREGYIGRAFVGRAVESHAGYTLARREPVIVEDFSSEKRFKGSSLLREHGVVSGLTVVIAGRDRPFGVLGAHSRRPRKFGHDHIHFFTAVANLLSQAVVREAIEREARQTQRELLQAQKMEAVGRLAGGMAHDFNNYLTGILGFSEMLAVHTDEAGSRDLGMIQELARRAARLTRQILTFSRRRPMEACSVHANQLLGKSVEVLPSLMGEDVEIEWDLQADPDTIHVDPGQIEQVLMNLAVNARDAMPRGGTLRIVTSNVTVPEPGVGEGESHPSISYLRITVSDDGVGMDESTLDRIFEPFFTTKEAGRGTGLGLSMVQGIISQHGGHLSVESRPGSGTTISIHLPLEISGRETPKEGETRRPFAGRRRDARILVVEDEASMLVLLERILRREGYTVLAAAGPAEAERIFAAEEGRIDLLLTDTVMPGKSGPQLYRELKSRFSQVRVLFISGYADRTLVSEEILEPGLPFLAKPFVPDTLLERVASVLAGG